MDKKIIIIFAVIAVIAVVAVAAFVMMGSGNGGDEDKAGARLGEEIATKDYPSTEGRLWVYGNANEDDKIDSSDVTALKAMISGSAKKTQLADANADGVIDDKDVKQLEAMLNAKKDTKLRVYYIDNYFKVAKIDWPVKKFATGFSSGFYAAEVAGVTDKIIMVDEMMYDGWRELNSTTANAPSFGDEESPDWEALLASDIDVYVPGWCESEADQLAPEKLKGKDVMFMNTSDNWYVKFPNEYIDRSITTFGYLIQGNMTQVYKWLNWHDDILNKLKTAAATLKESEKAKMIQARTDPAHSPSGEYLFIGYNQTNSIHAEWAGVYSVAQHDELLSKSNYPKITMEQLATIIDRNADSTGKIYFVDNENAGIVMYRDLDVTYESWHSNIAKTDTQIYWLGMTRELGNSALYLIEMIFYQNIMYPQLTAITGLDYKQELQYFIDNFAGEPDLYKKYIDIDQWFKVVGIA